MGDLTKNFSRSEFVCKCCGQVPKLDMKMVNLAQKLRDIVGPITPLSGYRCPKHNKAVKGATNSYHMKGMAIDVSATELGLTPPQLAQIGEKIGFTGIGLYDTFVHFDTRLFKTKFNKSTKWNFLEPKSKYYVKGITHVIETTPDNIRVALLADTVHNVNGINGTFFDVSHPGKISSIWGVAVQDGKVIGSGVGVPWVGARATIIYRIDGKLELKYITDITKEYDISKIRWAISGGGLLRNGLDIYNFKKENFQTDVTRKVHHTGMGFTKDGKVLLFVKPHTWYNPCPLNRLVQTAINLNLDSAIFLDGGGSSQLNYNGKGFKSTRKVSTAVVLKEN